MPCKREILSYDLVSIETYVESELKNIIRKMKDLEYDASSFLQKQSQEENLYKIEIEKIDMKIDTLLENLAEGNEMTIKYLNKKIEELDSRKTELINKLNELNSKAVRNDRLVEISMLAEKWDSLDVEDKKTIAKYFIKNITFYDNEIKINWNLFN
jgi:prefoldin subunit 5